MLNILSNQLATHLDNVVNLGDMLPWRPSISKTQSIMSRLSSGKELGSKGTNSIDYITFPNGHSAFGLQKWPLHGASAFQKDCMFKICEELLFVFGKTVEHKLVQFSLISPTDIKYKKTKTMRKLRKRWAKGGHLNDPKNIPCQQFY